MTSEATAITDPDSDPSDDGRRLLVVCGAVVLPLVLIAMTVSVVMIFGLRSNVSALQHQAYAAAKAAKALRAEVAGVRQDLVEPAVTSLAATEPGPTVPAPIAAGTTVFQSAARPIKVQSFTPIPVCVFHAGGDDSLASCIKRRIKS